MLRIDRWTTLYVSRPCARVARADRRARIPILMYHSISARPEPGVHPYYRVCTAPACFADQMQWLKDAGFRGTDIESAVDDLRGLSTGAPRPAVITFDDGFRDVLTEAWPILQRYGFTATVFLPTGRIANERCSFKRTECLTWPEVRSLRSQGLRFGSHTVNHAKLYELPWAAVDRELRDSRRTLEQELGEPIASFAYPYAFPSADRGFVGRLDGLLLECGYRLALTTMIGVARAGDNPLHLPRLPVNSADDERLFKAKLQGHYDWLGTIQNAFKSLKLRRRERTAQALGAPAAG